MHAFLMGVIAGPRTGTVALAFPQTYTFGIVGGDAGGWIAAGTKLTGSGSTAYTNRIRRATSPNGPWTTVNETQTATAGFVPNRSQLEFKPVGTDFVAFDTAGAGPYYKRSVPKAGGAWTLTATNIPNGDVPICWAYDGTTYRMICATNKFYTSTDGVSFTLVGTITGLPYNIGANSGAGEVRPTMYRVSTTYILMVGLNLHRNTGTNLTTGWSSTSTSFAVDSNEAMESWLFYDGTTAWIASRSGTSGPRIWTSTNTGSTWTKNAYTFPTDGANPATWTGSSSNNLIGMHRGGTASTDRYYAYSSRGIMYEFNPTGSVWANQGKSGLVNPAFVLPYTPGSGTGVALAQDLAAAPGASLPTYTDQLRPTTAPGNGIANAVFSSVDMDGAGAADPYFSNVGLLLHGDGADGATTFTDNSPTPKTPTTVGSTTLSTTTPKYGSASIKFLSNNTAGRLQYAHDASLHPGPTADFCVELWVRIGAVTAGAARMMCTKAISSGFTPYWLSLESNGRVRALSHDEAQTGQLVSLTSPNPLVLNTWTHVCYNRVGTTFRLFIDGVAVASSTGISGGIAQHTNPLVIGNTSDNLYVIAQGGDAYIDDLRITIGQGRYTANFTPTGPLPDN